MKIRLVREGREHWVLIQASVSQPVRCIQVMRRTCYKTCVCETDRQTEDREKTDREVHTKLEVNISVFFRHSPPYSC